MYLVYTKLQSKHKFDICMTYDICRYLGLHHIVLSSTDTHRFCDDLIFCEVLSSKGKPLITKARLETVWTRLADRFSTEVADTSMIIISPEYAGYFYEAPAYRTLQCLPVPRTRDSDSQSTNSCRRGRHIHVPCCAGGVVRPGPYRSSTPARACYAIQVESKSHFNP